MTESSTDPARGSGNDQPPALNTRTTNAEFVSIHATSVPLAFLNPFMIEKVIDVQARPVDGHLDMLNN